MAAVYGAGRRIIGGRNFARSATSLAILLVVAAALYFRYVGVQFERVLLPADIRADSGAGYDALLPAGDLRYFLVFRSDGPDNNSASRASLFENDVKLGPPHISHSNIASFGHGAYSHWGKLILFSASDDSDPRTNGRTYTFVAPAFLSAFWFWPVIGGAILYAGVFWLTPLVRRWSGEPDAAARGRAPAALARAALRGVIAAAAGLLVMEVPGLARGAVFWLVLGVVLVFALLAVRKTVIGALLFFGRDRALAGLQNAALIIGAITVPLAAFELYLAFTEASVLNALKAQVSPPGRTPVEARDAELQADGTLRIHTGRAEITLPASLAATMRERRNLITMPIDWKRETVTVPGATWAYRWQGVVHIFDQDNYRRLNDPFPFKDPGVFRIMVVGDSITYGAGIDARWSYPAQLERLLEKNYSVDVINLGRNGDQSEDVLRSLEKMAPIVKPDLIIYGVCLNDFLPSGVEQYIYSYSVPIPGWFKTMALERTRLAHLVNDGYQALLMGLHVRMDFYDDILSNFDTYQDRFGGDVARMNRFALARGLPPIVGIALDQFPNYGDRGYRIAMVAEAYMKKAGFDLISAKDYYRSYDGRQFIVSRWEGHPNEEADAIFATRIADHLYGRSDLERYRKLGFPG